MKGYAKFNSNSYYHLLNRAIGNELLFRTTDNYYYFLKRYEYYMSSVLETYAYCLMPNHIHFLIRPNEESVLIKHKKYKGDIHKLVMQQLSNLLNSYAKSYNKRYNRLGSLWVDYIKRYEIDSDSYLTAAINYIHQNPVNHGFVNHPLKWKYSSYSKIIYNSPSLTANEQVIEWFGNRSNFITFHQTETTHRIKHLRLLDF